MKRLIPFAVAVVISAALTAGILALLFNIRDRKQEARTPNVRVVALAEKDADPALWGRNFPREYDGYKRTSETRRTRYGGSEAFSRLDADPSWKRFYAGYPFGVDYREDRGHAYSLADQKSSLRALQFSQPGACLHCHGGGMKHVYETLGGGDLQAGFARMNPMPLLQAWKYVEHPVACVDCHDPATMALRVTRPAFQEGIKRIRGKEGSKEYDANTMASPQEMRTFVCAQCHVEYYFKGAEKMLTYPWHAGLKAEEIEAYYDEAGHRDWLHKETGAPLLKAQHPEFEMWSQGIHARSGVACADCHMPYKREGATKVTDHHVRSPLLNVRNACMACHYFSEAEMLARAEESQGRTRALLDRAEKALLDLMDAIAGAQAAGAGEPLLAAARARQRQAQWRLDFVASENSLGFHAPQEAARLLAESIDLARQGEIGLRRKP